MMNLQDDSQALSYGRYYRAARFPVIDPEITWLSYESIIDQTLEPIKPMGSKIVSLVEDCMKSFLSHTMCLPASSTFHHRTAGGLFYHSMETGALAADFSRDIDEVSDAMTLSAFLGGLLHDCGKVITFFLVSKLEKVDQDDGFGRIKASPRERCVWNPMHESLWNWCQKHQAKFLALEYTGSIEGLGHEARGAEIWRQFVPNELLEFISRNDGDAFAALTGYLDRKTFSHPLISVIREADRESVNRDINPKVRWQPKRSDLHIIRRFIEYSNLCAWNSKDTPFLMANIWIDGEDTEVSLPFFRTSLFNLHFFKDYLLCEESFGHAIQPKRQIANVCEVLDNYDILRSQFPECPAGRISRLKRKEIPGFLANLQFPEESGETFEQQPVAYFPMGFKVPCLGLREVRLLI